MREETGFELLPDNSILSSRILVVDDSELSRTTLRSVFENHHFHHVACANDGRHAIDILPSFRPQLIVLDLMMPHMDGYEFCRLIRSMPEFRDIPVLAQTALERQEDHNTIFRMGASDLITKPINAYELMARARIHLERFHLIVSLQQYHTRIANELALAREMQNDLMPSPTWLQHCRRTYHIDIAHYFETPSEMGGDMWGCKPLYEHELAVFMSDLSGHGVNAALNAFRLHTLMQEMSPLYGQNAGSYLDALNERLRMLLGKGQFATMFYGVIDTHTSSLHYASAATPHPLVLRGATGKMEKLNGSGYPLAMTQTESHYTTETVPFDVGDMLILYSDALIETPCRKGTFLDEDMLITYLADICASGLPYNVETIRDAIIDYFRDFTQSPIRDDLTLSLYHRL